MRTVKSCVGSTWCRFGVQDSVVARDRARAALPRPARRRTRSRPAVSGCARECAEAQSKDIGVIATENGWNLYVGGNGGFRPRHADLLLTDIDTATLVRTIDRFIMFYIRTADRLQRTAPLDRVGCDGRPGLPARGHRRRRSRNRRRTRRRDGRARRQLRRRVGATSSTIRTGCRRFVSFVNAPGTPDPSIAFAAERGQPRPVALRDRRAAGPRWR